MSLMTWHSDRGYLRNCPLRKAYNAPIWVQGKAVHSLKSTPLICAYSTHALLPYSPTGPTAPPLLCFPQSQRAHLFR